MGSRSLGASFPFLAATRFRRWPGGFWCRSFAVFALSDVCSMHKNAARFPTTVENAAILFGPTRVAPALQRRSEEMSHRTRRQRQVQMKARQTLIAHPKAWRMDRDTAATVAVARTLRQLLNTESGFHLMNRLLADRLEVDHLVVGPTGVFVIETCSDQDADAAITPSGRTDALQRARRAAAAIRDRLRRRGFDVGVQAVVCLPFSALQRPQYVDNIIVSRPEPLEYLIRHWPGQVLTPAQSARVFAALQPRVHRAAA